MTLTALHTDLYELTMLAGYFDKNMAGQPAAFDLYFRQAPFCGGFAVFAGLQPALDYLSSLRFREGDIDYLAGLGIFKKEFLAYLESFRFSGSVIAPAEGSVVFADEPLLTIEGSLAEAQFVETALLNIVNFQTLAATKAARIAHAAGQAEAIEFGLRRAQGPDGALSVARAAAIGGVCSTSNVIAGKTFGLPVKGTHAHSWVMAFEDELSAFRAYADVFPDACILLVDTYDTITSGLPNALTVAGELRTRGHELVGIRLDSGDIAEQSRIARDMFDQAGFPEVKIVASNELDEDRIRQIRDRGGRVDIYGVGTRLATCAGEGGGALGGVYKLVSLNGKPRLKTTNDPDKSTLPGTKDIWRFISTNGEFIADLVSLRDEAGPAPTDIDLIAGLSPGCRHEKIRQTVMRQGAQLTAPESLDAMTRRCMHQLSCLPATCLEPRTAAPYPVQISEKLRQRRDALVKAHEDQA